MDVFSSAYAPGVSAPSPMGLDPFFVCKTLQYLFHTQKVISCDIAELNPRFDSNQQTANLAARLVDFIISAV
jgi:formiminoglutamase